MDKYEAPRLIHGIVEPDDSIDKILNQQPVHDRIINYEVQFQLGDDVSTVQFKRLSLVPYWTIVGSYDENNLLNSILHKVEFIVGQVK